MGKIAVVFSGRNGLDFIELRQGVVRIPEVTLRLREAQKLLDAKIPGTCLDLLSTIAADDEHFFRNVHLKSLISAVVQVGLFDRYLRTQKRPEYMIGNSNGDAAMLVCSGRISFQSMIESSLAVQSEFPLERTVLAFPLTAAFIESKTEPRLSAADTSETAGDFRLPGGESTIPLLSGLTLTEYDVMRGQKDAGGAVTYTPLQTSAMDLRKLVSLLNQDHDVSCFINIGPASALRGSDYRSLGTGDLESVDSIELDPMLGWFWRNVRPHIMALAQ